uniref:Uncharacterized protein n=1 Tax=Chromera velia CCMP2878 TaxID=1169474 RepID=A0A0G4I2J0_9ALVE|eukprot:Cvel_10409.t1-p1 / transcript=Cvel_10409.t1 / gene=Cvel_10409 / organism=Chromera_velia_CCMP2878 / gene_product=hypothetical protein / transcript_product=hypothetical protein / location=Cvel_scaffold627:36407-37984(+) / protein_length=526 / sequence_SO=supercontig / SO=protein_coding / is_pseudo=false
MCQQGRILALSLLLLCPLCESHGSMYEPPSRNSLGLNLLGPTCAGGACQWYTQGATIGCDRPSGRFEPTEKDCEEGAEPTLVWWRDTDLLEYETDGHSPPVNTTYFPWRYPGSAPVFDACGTAGGGVPPLGQLDPPPGRRAGALGSDPSQAPKLLEITIWEAGSVVEVAWAVAANHGGGYQYRLCPASEPLTEECFQRFPLQFVGDKQWIQFGNGLDTSKRFEIPAKRVGGDKVIPFGSSWTKNPIPGCVINGAREKEPCLGPTSSPPLPFAVFAYGQGSAKGLFGYGGGHCMGNQTVNPDVKCTDTEYRAASFDFGIVDKVRVPADLPPGEYVVGFRWDCEQTKQIWSSCADVTVAVRGSPSTKPFSPQKGCTACCNPVGGLCANCTGCLHDRTGACAYCWTPQVWWDGVRHWSPRASHVQCLGFESEDGGASVWDVGDPVGIWSPGCPKCWRDKGGCEEHVRELVVSSSNIFFEKEKQEEDKVTWWKGALAWIAGGSVVVVGLTLALTVFSTNFGRTGYQQVSP